MKKNYLNHNTKLILALLILSMSSSVIAQQTTFCGTNHFFDAKKRAHSSQAQVANSEFRTDDVLTIRTVIHVVYNTDEENIPDEDIQTIMEELNELYLATDVDTSLVNPVHRSKITNTNIQFCLASEDPTGSPTNGITHTATDSVEFQVIIQNPPIIFESYKDDSTGGKSPWDVSRYLNIWIVRGGGANYGEAMPGHYPFANYVEETGIPGVTFDVGNFLPNSTSSFEPASVLAHECGHYLGLLHTFGFNPDNPLELCEVDDDIEDTPLCGFVTDSSIDPSNTCIEPENDELDNNTNIMSYSLQLMFTPDQTFAMRNNILNASPEILTDENCSGMSTTVSENPLNEKSFELFPNPNTGAFSIQFSNEMIGQDIQWSIYDVRGQEIQSQRVNDNQNRSQPINISIEQSGIYFMTVTSGAGSFTKKIMVKN